MRKPWLRLWLWTWGLLLGGLGAGALGAGDLAPGASAAALLSEGKLAFKAEKYEQAAALLERAVALDSANAKAHYFLGYAYSRLTAKDATARPTPQRAQVERAAAEFKTVIRLAPVYAGEQVVLDPYAKLCAEWGSLAMGYLAAEQVDSARWALTHARADGGLLAGVIEYNRNVLASCEQDALLVTNGDMDTFPIWYLQYVEGYRTDVTALNVNLLNTGWHLKQLVHGPARLPLSFDDAYIDHYLDRHDGEALRKRYWPPGRQQVTLLTPTDTLAWTVPATLFIPTQKGQTEGAENFLRVQDVVLLDLLRTNAWRRPVYFAVTVSDINMLGLTEDLGFEGLVFHLLPLKRAGIQTERLAQNCRERFQYTQLADEPSRHCGAFAMMVRNYRSGLLQLAYGYLQLQRDDEARATLAFLDRTVPEHLYPIGNPQLEQAIKQLREAVAE